MRKRSRASCPKTATGLAGYRTWAQLSFVSVEFISADRTTESYQKQDFIVLVLSIAVLVIELAALPQHSRFDHEHEHRFTEHEHDVVF